MIRFPGAPRATVTRQPSVANLLLSSGQSNSDVLEDLVVAMMAEEGISNPVYSEAPVPGSPFRKWYTSAGAEEYLDGSDTLLSVTSLTQGGGTARLTVASHDIDVTTKIRVSGAVPGGYNGLHRVDAVGGGTWMEYDVHEDLGSPATGTMTVRRAGCYEVWLRKCQELIMDGYSVNVLGVTWMQGEGNAGSGDPYTELRYLPNMIEALRTWCNTTLPESCGRGLVSVDPLWGVAIGLTAYTQWSGTFRGGPVELGMVRRMQREATWYKSYAWWVDTQHYYRSDGTHTSMDDAVDLKRRQLRALRQQVNIPSPHEYA